MYLGENLPNKLTDEPVCEEAEEQAEGVSVEDAISDTVDNITEAAEAAIEPQEEN